MSHASGASASGHAGTRTRVSARYGGSGPTVSVDETARRGLVGNATLLPFFDFIQQSFGAHDIGDLRAHVGREAAQACGELEAKGYAVGEAVAFAAPPDLHAAAHEAAHVVQQRGGVTGGRGNGGDAWERHADAVADEVVAGRSAEALLANVPDGAAPSLQCEGEEEAAPAAEEPAPAAAEEPAPAAPEEPAAAAVSFDPFTGEPIDESGALPPGTVITNDLSQYETDDQGNLLPTGLPEGTVITNDLSQYETDDEGNLLPTALPAGTVVTNDFSGYDRDQDGNLLPSQPDDEGPLAGLAAAVQDPKAWLAGLNQAKALIDTVARPVGNYLTAIGGVTGGAGRGIQGAADWLGNGMAALSDDLAGELDGDRTNPVLNSAALYLREQGHLMGGVVRGTAQLVSGPLELSGALDQFMGRMFTDEDFQKDVAAGVLEAAGDVLDYVDEDPEHVPERLIADGAAAAWDAGSKKVASLWDDFRRDPEQFLVGAADFTGEMIPFVASFFVPGLAEAGGAEEVLGGARGAARALSPLEEALLQGKGAAAVPKVLEADPLLARYPAQVLDPAELADVATTHRPVGVPIDSGFDAHVAMLRLAAGDADALRTFGMEPPADFLTTSTEWGISQLPDGRWMLIKGKGGDFPHVLWSDYDGVVAAGHSHPLVDSFYLLEGVDESGRLPITALGGDEMPAVANRARIDPSPGDLAFAADQRVADHHLYTIFRYVGDDASGVPLLANPVAGEAAGTPVHVIIRSSEFVGPFAGNPAYPVTRAEIELWAGGQRLSAETVYSTTAPNNPFLSRTPLPIAE